VFLDQEFFITQEIDSGWQLWAYLLNSFVNLSRVWVGLPQMTTFWQ